MKKTIQRAALSTMLATILPEIVRAGDDHEHHGDIIVGRSLLDVLAVEYDFDEPTVLAPVSGLLAGWAGDEPGFDHLEANEPDEDFYSLAAGANIVFELVNIDQALVGNPLGSPLDAPGARFVLGDHELHQHIDWLIDSTDPAFNPVQTVWSLQFRLIDIGATGYGASDVYDWHFTNMPEPGSAGLMLAACAWAIRRKR